MIRAVSGNMKNTMEKGTEMRKTTFQFNHDRQEFPRSIERRKKNERESFKRSTHNKLL